MLYVHTYALETLHTSTILIYFNITPQNPSSTAFPSLKIMPRKSKASYAQSERWKLYRQAQSMANPQAIPPTRSRLKLEASPTPPPSFSDHPPEPYWLSININHQEEEEELDPLEMHLYAQSEIADSSDEEKLDPELFKHIFYPVFTQKCVPELTLGKRKTNTGMILKGYKKPRFEPGRAKGFSAIESRQTKFSRKKKREAALGKNNLCMSNWMNQAKAKVPPPPSSTHSDNTNDLEGYEPQINSPTEPETLTDDEIPSDSITPPSTFDPNLSAAQDLWIDQCVDQYHKSPTVTISQPEKIQNSAQEYFKDLESAINYVSKNNWNKSKTNQMISDLPEYNKRRLELTINGVSSPTVTACVLTACSSIRRDHANSKATTGCSRAKTIRKQAFHLLKFKELRNSQRGHHSSRASLLKDKRFFDALKSWAVAKKPGEVSLFFIFIINFHVLLSNISLNFVQKLSPPQLCDHANNVVLPDLGYDKKISIVTCYRWLRQLGF